MTRTPCAPLVTRTCLPTRMQHCEASGPAFTLAKCDAVGDGTDALALLLSACGQLKRPAVSKEKALMKGHDFRRWRKGLELSQKEAADALGLKRRVVQYYEKGER